MKARALMFSLALLGSGACSRQDRGRKITKLEMLEKARQAESSVEVMLPKDLNSGIKCRSENGEFIYGPGCLHGFQVKVGDLDLIALEFDSEESARKEALRLGQFYYANWVLDDVAKEPALERFVKAAFSAVNPSQESPAGEK